MHNFWHSLHTALTFLTPLGRARIVSEQQLQNALYCYPLVGCILGFFLFFLAKLPLSSSLLAWILLGANFLLTRGLHWDGWADLFDAWGSGKQGEEFWKILKDSRIGAFGVVGLILGLGVQYALFGEILDKGQEQVFVFFPTFGRFCCLVFARSTRAFLRPGLGSTVLRGVDMKTLVFGGITTLLPALMLSASFVIQGLFLALLGFIGLRALVRLHQGVNGDFLGCALIWGELSVLFPICL